MPDSPLYPSRVPVLRHAFALWRRLRRLISRSEWTVRTLGLPVAEGCADEPGLILFQIDGCSRHEFERALAAGRMPYIRKLIRRERLMLHTLYPGQPATTPAVLGELFYGVRQAVPAFAFRDHVSGQVVQMIEPEIAVRIQDELARNGEGLLAGGSAYCDIYSGGAAESQFCPGSMRWTALDDAAVWKKIALILLNARALLRMFRFSIAELGLGLVATVRSRIGRREWKYELPFIPRRMIGNVLIREATAIAAEADATRGLPIVHANFVGYDELAHRRGPGSRYAHRALRDIDRAIRRIGNAAFGSRRRAYRVWIMSDHGQETTAIYSQESGREITDAVAELYADITAPPPSPGSPSQRGAAYGRPLPAANAGTHGDGESPKPTVVAVGPLGYVYWPHELSDDDVEVIGARLAAECRVPLVMARSRGRALAWTAAGRFRMPDEAAQILGDDHPHLRAVADDFVNLLSHPDAGDFLISGWRLEAPPLSFVAEHGAHGGPGPLETSGFVLLSPDARPPAGKTLRPSVLRQLVREQIGTAECKPAHVERPRELPLRIVTYNVHSCIGLDGRLSPQRIARVLADLDPDIVALQELDVGRARTGGADQARAIAAALRMDLQFHPCLEVTGELYGNAVLSRLPMSLVKAERFPVLHDRHEPRGALWVKIQDGPVTVDVITTHLGLTRVERAAQVDRLLGADWLNHPDCGPHIVFCGDLNAGPRSNVYRRLSLHLRDAQLATGLRRPRRTWFGPWPLAALDHIFVGPKVESTGTELVDTVTARIASDHLPLVADVQREPCSRRESSGPVPLSRIT